ncbi:hypothetical protein [Chroococcus sp. FPU101]|uniref:hypothetical protein n=1 Tax=Chroococcus sp. FPU101 TaxID=1974212 RepID=UPI001A8CFCE6|nr:hypothetical protein [Chroococcus sp. FPU101]GFE71548.1 hypothetical protein CFPU101_41580 [Chroococcus sp. FPU101]
MKTFCILEQGEFIDDPLTLKHKKLFTTDFSDFYRLNWRTEKDQNAFWIEKNITWSEGRSILFEKVPKNYDYYILIDDDVEFDTDNDVDIALKIKELLIKYQPLAGTFYDPTRWCFQTEIERERYFAKECFPIAGYDAQVQIFSKSFADVMFPAIYHGSAKAFWYTSWACYKLYPLKQVCFTDIRVKNTRHMRGEGVDKQYLTYNAPEKIVELFKLHIKDNSFFSHRDEIIKINTSLFEQPVDSQKIDFTLEDFGKIYDINNHNFRNRKSKIEFSKIQSELKKLSRKLAKLSNNRVTRKLKQLSKNFLVKSN